MRLLIMSSEDIWRCVVISIHPKVVFCLQHCCDGSRFNLPGVSYTSFVQRPNDDFFVNLLYFLTSFRHLLPFKSQSWLEGLGTKILK